MILHQVARQARFAPDKMGKVSLAAGEFLYAGLNCFEPGQEHRAHVHTDQDKLYLILEGVGEAAVGEEVRTVVSGDVVFAPAGVIHALRNTGAERLVAVTVFGPPPAPR